MDNFINYFLAFFLSCQRYNYYIENGIDLDHVSPLEESWVESIMKRVSPNLRRHSASLELLVDEIKEDYLHSIKTAICIYSYIYTFNPQIILRIVYEIQN